MTEPSRIDRRIATSTTVVLLVLGSAIFLAGAISAADTLVGSGPDDRALSRQSAVLAVQVVAASSDSTPERSHDRDGRHAHDRHATMHGTPVPARVTIETGDQARTFQTNDHGYVHLDLRSGAYTLGIETRLGSDATPLDVNGLTHVRVEVSQDGSMTFTVEHHRPHQPPFRGAMAHDATHEGAAHDRSHAERDPAQK